MQVPASTAPKNQYGAIREPHLVLKKLPLSGGLYGVDRLLELLSAICERFACMLFQKRVFHRPRDLYSLPFCDSDHVEQHRLLPSYLFG
jgi:hypothetical protein